MLKLVPILFLLFSCTKKVEEVSELALTGTTMGTRFSIKYYPSDKTPKKEEVLEKVTAVLVDVNQQMSTYIADSEIVKFNTLKTTDSWFEVSKGFHEVTRMALGIAAQTEGIYDPTVGPLVDLWGFGQKKSKTIPSPKQIIEVLKTVGYKKIIVSEEGMMIRKTDVNTHLDLSSIAKGFGVDQVAKVLDDNSISHYMVEIGGEVKTKGGKPNIGPWTIGVSAPVEADVSDTQKLLSLQNEALATSGDYRNFYEVDGKRYAHIIDPRTGSPAKSDLASVSVITADGNCSMADGYATALLAMGSSAAKAFAAKYQLAVFLIIHGENGQFVEWMTPEFEKYVKTGL